METWHYARDENNKGSVNSEQLKQMAATGELSPTDLIWKEGMADWVPASSVEGLFAANAAPPPVPPTLPPGGSAAPPASSTEILLQQLDRLDEREERYARKKSNPVVTAIRIILGVVVVFILLAILAAIVIPMFSDASYEATQAKIDTDISSLMAQCELYHAQTGQYPSALADLTREVPAGVDLDGDGSVGRYDVYGPWIMEVPLRPNGQAYTYNPGTGYVSAP